MCLPVDPRLRALFDRLDLTSSLYAAEARDHARRLRAAVPFERWARLLDYGCGPGLVAGELAPYAAEIALWDALPSMRPWTEAATAAHPELHLVDLSRHAPPAHFDVILMSNVVQYFDDDELAAELERLGRALTPGGCIVVSDVPTPDRNLAVEALELLRFAASEGILAAAVREQARVWTAYRGMLRAGCFVLRSAADLQRLAATAGLRADILPVNLTHRRRRLSAVLRRADAS